MGQALTLLLTGTQLLISSSKPGSFSTQGNSQPWGRADMTFPPTSHSPPSRGQGQGRPSAGCLAAQTQALFQKLLPSSPSSTKRTCQTACWKAVGVGEGREMTVRAPQASELHVLPLTECRYRWSSLIRVGRILPEGGVCSRLTTRHPPARLVSLTPPASVKAAGSLLKMLSGQHGPSPGHSRQMKMPTPWGPGTLARLAIIL